MRAPTLRTTIGLAVSLMFTACASRQDPHREETASSTPSTAPTSDPSPSPDTDASSPVASAEPASTSPPSSASPSPPAADPRQLIAQSITNGSATLASAVDPVQGLLVIQYVEPPAADHSRSTISADHLCGAQLVHGSRSVRAVMGEATGLSAIGTFQCAGNTCTIPGVEYAANVRFQFVQTSSGELRLAAIMMLSQTVVRESSTVPMEQYIARQLAAVRLEPCHVAPTHR